MDELPIYGSRWDPQRTRRVMLIVSVTVLVMGVVVVAAGAVTRGRTGNDASSVAVIAGISVAWAGVVMTVLAATVPRWVSMQDREFLQVPGLFRVRRIPRDRLVSATARRDWSGWPHQTVTVTLDDGTTRRLVTAHADRFLRAINGQAVR